MHMFLCPHCSPSGEGENFRPNIRYVFFTALGADCKLQCNNVYNRKLIVYSDIIFLLSEGVLTQLLTVMASHVDAVIAKCNIFSE